MNPIARAKLNPPRVREGEVLDGPVKDREEPLPLRALLTRPVMVSVLNYCVIALLDLMAVTLIPLVWSTSVELGGLGISPASIGLWIGGYGLINGVFQFVALPCFVRRFGPRGVFITSILCHFPLNTMFPLENLALRHSSRGLYPVAGLLIMLQLMATSFSSMELGK
jgi:hypothetical protein